MSVILETAIAGDERKRKHFSVVNSTGETGLVNYGDALTYAATEGFIIITNAQVRSESPNGNVIVCPDYVRLTCISAPGKDGSRILWMQDSVTRYSTGGTSLTTLAANCFTDTYSEFDRVTASAQIYAGNISLAAASSAFAIAENRIRSTTGAVDAIQGDEYTFTFGGGSSSGNVSPSLGAIKGEWGNRPVYLGPGSCMIGHLIIDAATAAVGEYKVEVGWVELHHDFNA